MSLSIGRDPSFGVLGLESQIEIKQAEIGSTRDVDTDEETVRVIVARINEIVIDHFRSIGIMMDRLDYPKTLADHLQLRMLLDSSEFPVMIVPNEMNKAPSGSILIGREISITETNTITAGVVDQKNLHLTGGQIETKLPICGISERATQSLDRVIEKLSRQEQVRSLPSYGTLSTPRTFTHYQPTPRLNYNNRRSKPASSSWLECCPCTLI